jgi:hypothetical protein
VNSVEGRIMRRWVDILLTGGQDALIGTGLLADSVLTIDFVDKNLEIVRKGI